MSPPIIIGVCAQQNSGGGGGGITFTINSVGGNNQSPVTSPPGSSSSFADVGNSFTFPLAVENPPNSTGFGTTLVVGGTPEGGKYDWGIRYDSTPFNGSQNLFSAGKVLDGASSGPNAGLAAKISWEYDISVLPDPALAEELVGTWWAIDPNTEAPVQPLSASPGKIEIHILGGTVPVNTAMPGGGGFVTAKLGDPANPFVVPGDPIRIISDEDPAGRNADPERFFWAASGGFFDDSLFGVASIPMLQTITFIALDGTESTASQNLIWTCGPDPSATPIAEILTYP
jgi:hypothetical protein